MSCVVRWWDVLFVNGMHFSSKNARLLNYQLSQNIVKIFFTVSPVNQGPNNL